jgi:steroid 5-alpha reductase family enzyme
MSLPKLSERMTNNSFLLFLTCYLLVCQHVAASPKGPAHYAMLRFRGGQGEPVIHLQVERDALSEGITVAIPDDPSLIPGRTFLSSPTPARTFGSNLKQQFETLRSKASQLPDLAIITERSSKVFIDAVVPATVAFRDMFLNPSGGMTLPGVYALALLGSSSGFYMFLYFITVGYAFGIMLPVLVSLYAYNSQGKIPVLSNLHSGLVIAWAIRASSYFLHREYVNWPLLHEKVVEVNKMAKLSSKMFCWVIYSIFYVLMVCPCLFRLESGTTIPWGLGGKSAIGVQAFGLLLEALADYQKSTFKATPGNRGQWCHVGVWKVSTHPNYLGELLFWYGTYFAGMAAYTKPLDWILATLGLLFITLVMKGAVSSLGAKHLRKYNNNEDFVQFRKSHNMFGPKLYKWS